MSVLDKFKENIKQQDLFAAKDKLLLAVSGGVDSVALCELCKQAGYHFTIAHCNFQLRGQESERDEEFVVALAKKYNTEALVEKFDTEAYAVQKKISIQEAARDLRYAWFKQIIREDSRLQKADDLNSAIHNPSSANYILTAHHADDNAETLLMNFCRGTGLKGLTGIPMKTDNIRRPLLIFSKKELIAFASQNDLGFVEDSSNQSSKYTRNLFRNDIIPLISQAYPAVSDNLQDNIRRFTEIEKLYRLAVGSMKKKLCRQKGEEIHIPVKQLLALQNKALVYEIIADFGFGEKQVDDVISLANSDSGKFIKAPSGPARIIKHRHWLILTRANVPTSEIIMIEGIGNLPACRQVWELGMGDLEVKVLPIAHCQLSIDNTTACLDAKEIQFPLLLRKWKPADYFYPLGMRKKKKLSRFFIDQKMSKTEKENVWVIESAGKIIWVVGHRIDERFKITESTQEVLQLKII